MSSLRTKFGDPVRLPNWLTRWMPRSFTVALGASLLLVLWMLPLYPAYIDNGQGNGPGPMVAGWKLRSLMPWAASVPVCAALLLVMAWVGDRRTQLGWLLTLIVQAIGIALFVPLGLYSISFWLYLILFVTSISWIRDAVVHRELAHGAELNLPLRLRAGLIAVGISLLLWVPYGLSRAYIDRWDNPLFAGPAKLLGHRPPLETAPPTHNEPQPRMPAASVESMAASPDSPTAPPPEDPRLVRTSIPFACNAPVEAELTTLRDAWNDGLDGDRERMTLVEMDRQRTDYLRKLVELRLGGPVRAGLGSNIDSVLSTASEIYQRTPSLSTDLRAPPSLSWLRPLAARQIAAYSFDPAASGSARESMEDAADGSTPPLRVFPIGLHCAHFDEPGRFDAGHWIYPRIAAGAAAPASIVSDGEETLVQFEPASMARVAGVVDFARFVGAPVAVELASSRNDDEIHMAVSSLQPRAPVWAIRVETDLPAFLVQSGRLIRGRLVRAAGGDRCRSDVPGFEIVTHEKLQGTVDGFILSGSDANETRIHLVDTEPNEKVSGTVRRLGQTTRFDLDGDSQADLNLTLWRFQWRRSEDDSGWIAGPSYRGKAELAATAATAAAQIDSISYENCETM